MTKAHGDELLSDRERAMADRIGDRAGQMVVARLLDAAQDDEIGGQAIDRCADRMADRCADRIVERYSARAERVVGRVVIKAVVYVFGAWLVFVSWKMGAIEKLLEMFRP